MELEFHHFIFLLLPRILQTQRSLCRSEDQIVQSPTQCSIVQSEFQRSSFFLCSSFLFKSILPLFFVKSFFLFFFRSAFNCPIGVQAFFIIPLFIVPLKVPKSSLKYSILLYRTQVYKTRHLSDIIFPTHQVGIESLTLKF